MLRFYHPRWWFDLSPIVRLLKTPEVNTQSMNVLRMVLFKHIQTIRVSDTFMVPELATDLLEYDLNRPTGDEDHQKQADHAGPEERQQPGQNAGDSHDGQPPTRRQPAGLAGYLRPQRKNPVGERVGSPQEREREQCEVRPCERHGGKGKGSMPRSSSSSQFSASARSRPDPASGRSCPVPVLVTCFPIYHRSPTPAAPRQPGQMAGSNLPIWPIVFRPGNIHLLPCPTDGRWRWARKVIC